MVQSIAGGLYVAPAPRICEGRSAKVQVACDEVVHPTGTESAWASLMIEFVDSNRQQTAENGLPPRKSGDAVRLSECHPHATLNSSEETP